MGLSQARPRTHEERAAIVDVALDELEQFRDSMKVRQAKYNSNARARHALKTRIGSHLRAEAPGSVLDHQIDAFCLMKGLVDDEERGGVCADEAGLGKTLTCLLFGRMLCPADRLMIVLAPKVLVDSVWELEILKWLKDQRHEVINSASEVPALVKRKDSLGGYFIIVNEQDMVVHDAMWSQLSKLQPAFLFIDEGAMLGTARNKAKLMVEAIKASDTISFIVSATPFKDGDSRRTDNTERKFVQAMVQYDAVTRKREPYQTLTRRTDAAKTRIAGSTERAVSSMDFIIRHSADEIRHLLPRLQFITKQAQAPNARTHRRFATFLAIQQRHVILDDRAAAEKWLKRVLELSTFEPRKVIAKALDVVADQLRRDTSAEYADNFSRQLATGEPEIVDCQQCRTTCNCLPLWLPCCKKSSPWCTACVIDSSFNQNSEALAAFRCPSCGEDLNRKQLQSSNRAGSCIDFSVTKEDRLEKTMRGQALLQLLRPLKNGRKVLLAGVSATNERLQICNMLTRKRIRYSCPLESQNGDGILSALCEFANVPEIRVLILPKNLKQGVDHLKVACKIIFWDAEHLDYRNLVTRHSIIKRVCRLGCEHKSVDVVTLQQSFLAEQSSVGCDRSALRPLHLCPLEDEGDESDAPASPVSKKRPAEISTEVLQDSLEKEE